jgi:hypothetical protein
MWLWIALGLFCLFVFVYCFGYTTGPPPGYKTESFEETVKKLNKLNKITASGSEGSSSSGKSSQPGNASEPESAAP